jgi:hypothetical protein
MFTDTQRAVTFEMFDRYSDHMAVEVVNLIQRIINTDLEVRGKIEEHRGDFEGFDAWWQVNRYTLYQGVTRTIRQIMFYGITENLS